MKAYDRRTRIVTARIPKPNRSQWCKGKEGRLHEWELEDVVIYNWLRPWAVLDYRCRVCGRVEMLDASKQL